MTITTGVEALERSVHNANAWLADLSEQVGADRQAAYRTMRAFLHTVRDRLTVEQGAHLAAQLPHLWRGVFYEGWAPSRSPDSYRDQETFLQRLADEAQLAGTTEASLAAEACARVLREHIDDGEYQHVLNELPDALRPLFE